MDSLDELRKQFMAVQKKGTVKKLSERTCVQVVSKLIESGQLEVLHTLNGKEYVTPERLKREISDEMYVRGGRVTLADLQAATNVDPVYIARAVKALQAQDPNITVLESGDVISEAYLDAAFEAAAQTLALNGQMSIGELAEQLQLPTNLVNVAVAKRLESILRAELRGSTLFTAAFVHRETGRIRGAFSAVTRPVSIAAVVAAHGFDDRIIDSVLREMIGDGSLCGTLRGREYVPSVFTVFQRNSAETFLRQNEHLPFDRAAKLQITDTYTFLKSQFPGLLKLDTCVVLESVKHRVSASVEAAVASNTWIDVCSDMTWLSTRDVSALLSHCSDQVESDWTYTPSSETSANSTKALVLLDSHVVPFNYLDAIVNVFKAQAAKEAEAAVVQVHSATGAGAATAAGAAQGSAEADDDEEYCIVNTGSTPSTPMPSAGAGAGTGKGKGGPGASASATAAKGKGKAAGKAAIVDDDDDDSAAGKKRGGKSKRGKGRRGDSDSEEDEAPAPSAAGKKGGKAIGSVASGGKAAAAPAKDSVTTAAVEAVIRDLDKSGIREVPELVSAIAKTVIGTIRTVTADVKKAVQVSVFQGGAASRRKWIQFLTTRLTELFPLVSTLAKGLDLIDTLLAAEDIAEAVKDKAAAVGVVVEGVKPVAVMLGTLHSHLSTEYLHPYSVRLLVLQCLLNDVTLPAAATAANGHSTAVPFSTNEPPCCAGLATSDVATLARSLKSADPGPAASIESLFGELGKRGLRAGNFVVLLERALDACKIRVPKVDKKVTRQLLFTHQQEVVTRLTGAVSSSEVLQLTLVSVIQQEYSCALLLPNAWPFTSALLPLVTRNLPAESATLLNDFSEHIVSYSAQSAEGSASELATPAGEVDSPSDSDVVVVTVPVLSRERSAELLGDEVGLVRAIGLSKMKAQSAAL